MVPDDDPVLVIFVPDDGSVNLVPYICNTVGRWSLMMIPYWLYLVPRHNSDRERMGLLKICLIRVEN